MTKRRATYRLLTDKDREIDNLNIKINDITTSTGKQILKLEDELSRMSMAKEVVVQEKNQVKAELDKVKSDDGGKKMIAQLSSKIKQMEAEKAQKIKEMETMEENLKRKLAKQIAENRLMRITLKETEAEYSQRIMKLENDVLAALETLVLANERQVANMQEHVITFDKELYKAKREYLLALKKSKENVLGLTDTLIDIKSMHSNLPQRIRSKLRELSPEELLIILDVLSFEDSVLQYLEARWPLEDQLEELSTPRSSPSSSSKRDVKSETSQHDGAAPTQESTASGFEGGLAGYSMGTPGINVETPDSEEGMDEENSDNDHNDEPPGLVGF
eukprot:TRINITY_DN68120_c1_g3_i2.p1 TRINITY_DN68120_c1_g3~~TRINITY_DN68120_c1_g3_i2.p1  ORF type:complete len:382 (+),score=60.72 TRINITY_DN68120_c1_g3_i2:151-1146(+)